MGKLKSKKFKVFASIFFTLLMLSGLSFEFYQNEYLQKKNNKIQPKQVDIATVIPKQETEVAKAEEPTKSEPVKQNTAEKTKSAKTSKTKAKIKQINVDGALLYSQLNFQTINEYSTNDLPGAKICNPVSKKAKLDEEYDRYIAELAQINKEFNNSLELLDSQFSPPDAPDEANDQKIWAEIDNLSEETKSRVTAAETKFQTNYMEIENGCY